MALPAEKPTYYGIRPADYLHNVPPDKREAAEAYFMAYVFHLLPQIGEQVKRQLSEGTSTQPKTETTVSMKVVFPPTGVKANLFQLSESRSLLPVLPRQRRQSAESRRKRLSHQEGKLRKLRERKSNQQLVLEVLQSTTELLDIHQLSSLTGLSPKEIINAKRNLNLKGVIIKIKQSGKGDERVTKYYLSTNSLTPEARAQLVPAPETRAYREEFTIPGKDGVVALKGVELQVYKAVASAAGVIEIEQIMSETGLKEWHVRKALQRLPDRGVPIVSTRLRGRNKVGYSIGKPASHESEHEQSAETMVAAQAHPTQDTIPLLAENGAAHLVPPGVESNDDEVIKSRVSQVPASPHVRATVRTTEPVVQPTVNVPVFRAPDIHAEKPRVDFSPFDTLIVCRLVQLAEQQLGHTYRNYKVGRLKKESVQRLEEQVKRYGVAINTMSVASAVDQWKKVVQTLQTRKDMSAEERARQLALYRNDNVRAVLTELAESLFSNIHAQKIIEEIDELFTAQVYHKGKIVIVSEE